MYFRNYILYCVQIIVDEVVKKSGMCGSAVKGTGKKALLVAATGMWRKILWRGHL